MYNPLSPKGFLRVGGMVLILLGFLSYLPSTNDPRAGILGFAWWFSSGEGVAHILLGVVAILSSYVLPDNLLGPLVLVIGALAALFGLLGGIVFSGPAGANLYGLANLEPPLDNILHLAIAAWAFYAALARRAASRSKIS